MWGTACLLAVRYSSLLSTLFLTAKMYVRTARARDISQNVNSLLGTDSAGCETTWTKANIVFIIGILIFAILPEFAPGGSNPPVADITCGEGHGDIYGGWCQTNSFDVYFTKAFVGVPPKGDPKASGYISHIFTMGICPLIAFGSAFTEIIWPKATRNCNAAADDNNKVEEVERGEDGREGFESCTCCIKTPKWVIFTQDCLVLFGVFFINTGFTDFVKATAKRQRPCYYYQYEGITEANGMPQQQYASFFSGDTSIAWAFVVGGFVIARMRRRSFAMPCVNFFPMPRYLIWSASSAFIGSMLRIAGFMHWMTDVLTGCFVGCIVGLLPLMLYTSRGTQLNTAGGQVHDAGSGLDDIDIGNMNTAELDHHLLAPPSGKVV